MLRRHWRPVSVTFSWLLASCATATPSVEPDTQAPAAQAMAAQPVAAEAIVVDVGGDSLVLPKGLTSFGAANSDGQLYIFGGYFGSPHAYSKAEQSGDLLRLDIASGAWQRVGTSGRAQGVALVAHGDSLVRIGGMQASNEKGTSAVLNSLASVEAFDVKTASWSALAPLPAPRSSHDAIVVGDTVWVLGGWTLKGEEKVWHEDLLRMDLSDAAAKWVETPIPFKRRALATASAKGKIVVMGGITPAGKLSSAVDIYDPKTDKWSSGPKFPGPGFGMAATSEGDVVYASGMAGVVFSWSPGDKEWTKVQSLAYPRFFHRIVPTDSGELLVVGGIRGMRSGTRVRPIERVAIGQKKGQTTILAYELDSPLPSKNRQGVALVGDSLLMFGGNKSMGQHDFEPKFFTDVGFSLDLASMKWHEIAPYPVARQTMSTFTTAKGDVVSVAGFGHDGKVARSHADVFAYNPKKNEWTAAGKLPGQGRTQFGLAVRKDELVVFGGLDYDPTRAKGDRFRHEMPLLKAPTGKKTITFDTTDLKLQQPRRAFAGALLDNTYYLVGGMKDGFALVDGCDAFDFAKSKWKTIACPKRQRLSAEMVAMNGKLYLAAGSSKDKDGKLGSEPSLEVYDPASNTWSTLLEQLPIETKHVRMLQYGDRLLLVNTHNEQGKAHVVLIAPGV